MPMPSYVKGRLLYDQGLYDEALAPFEDATTDSRGAFRLLEVGDGAWTVRAAREGYAPAEREVRVDGSAPESLELVIRQRVDAPSWRHAAAG